MSLDEAREELKNAASIYGRAPDSVDAVKVLCMAAVAYAAERSKSVPAPAPQARRSDDVVIPFGRSKGTPIADAETNDLEWVAGALTKSIDDPAKARWADADRALLAAIEAELATR